MTMPGDYSEELVELVARTLWDECRRELGSHLKDEPSGTCFTDARAILDALSSAGPLVPEGSEVREEYVVTGVDEEGGRWISFPQSMTQAEHALASFGGRLGVRRVITTPATPWTPSEPAQEERPARTSFSDVPNMITRVTPTQERR